MKTLIVGGGALGRLCAARLQLAGLDVSLRTRRAEHAVAFGRQGIELRELDGRVVRVPVRLEEKDGSGVYDLLLLCVKAFDVDAALAGALDGLKRDGTGGDGIVLVLANGLGVIETVEQRWSPGRCFAGVVHLGAVCVGDTGVEVRGTGRLAIGSRSPHARPDALVELFVRAGFAAEAAEDVESAIWEKAALNCAVNPMAALLEIENGRLPVTPAFDMCVRAAEETAAVARAAGIALAADGWRERLLALCTATARNRCSMLEDLSAGRRTENEYLSLAVAARGEKVGAPAPVNALLGGIIAGVE